MKRFILFFGVIVFAMVTTTLTAQNGGMNIGSLQANESVQVGTASESVVVLSDLIALPPLTDSEIQLIFDPAEGSIVYATESDILLVFDGEKWRRADGQNDSYLLPFCPSSVTDYDNNSYSTVLIGTQCWMAENLKVTHYPNGDLITSITDNSAWALLADNNTDDAYCYYDNNVNMGYGALYTYAAAIADNWQWDITSGQGICPDGWHLPTDAEWTVLTDFLDGSAVAGGKMKETGTLHWDPDNIGATNESGFTALPGGTRDYFYGEFNSVGIRGYWWSATDSDSNAWYRGLYYNNANENRDICNKSFGNSVRCARD